MSIKLQLPKPPEQWTQNWHQRFNQYLENNDLDVRKKRTDVELGPGEKLVLRSPDGHRWSIVVSNAGALSTVLLP